MNAMSSLRLFPVLLWTAGGAVILFLVAPIAAIVPLSFTTPLLCNSTIQAQVRTRSEVQNGSRTKIISRFDRPGGSVASR